MRRALAVLVAIGSLAGCGGVPGPPTAPDAVRVPNHPPPRFDAARAFTDLRAEVKLGPRPAGSAADRRDAAFIAKRLRAAGARGVRIQRPFLNVVGEVPGTEPGAIVIGAHHDTKGIQGFVGANDGASGVAVVLELARALAPHWTGPALHFALFDAEESPGPGNGAAAFIRSGDRGSRQYVRYAARGLQGTPELSTVRAMVLLDLVGDCDLALPHEANSDPGLYQLFADAGPAEVFRGESGGVLDDHTPFEKAGVPSLDLIDFAYGPGPPPGAYFHTRADNLSHVCAASLGAVGSAAVAALPKIG